MRKLLLVALLVPLPGAAPIWGQGTITNGDAVFVRGASAFDDTPEASFSGVSTTTSEDHLFETGWWFRIAGETQEAPLGLPVNQSYNGDTSTIFWSSFSTAPLEAQEVSVVTDGGMPGAGQDGGFVRMELWIVNTGPTDVTIDVFHYVDFDVQPQFGNDSATLIEHPNLIRIFDPGGSFAQYRAIGADAWQVLPFPMLRDLLNDAATTELDDTGLPFGPADFTGGAQWSDRVLAANGGNATFTVYLAVNSTLACATPVTGIFCDDLESGDTGFWSFAVP